jgi:hypothetical protein
MQTANIGSWGTLLNIFHGLIENTPEPKKIEGKLLALKEDAKNAADLTPKQREGIMDRVNNYLKGEYGNTKTAENLGQSKPEKK